MEQRHTAYPRYRWFLISSIFVVMMIISIYQYSWFLFAYAIQKQFNWALSTIGLTFTIFTYAATFIQPFSGVIADTCGPRIIAPFASLIVGIGYILSAYAGSPQTLYLYYGIGGLGVGIMYGISVACAIKWFPDRRGFAAGLVVFGFGAGTALFNRFIEGLLESVGLQTTFRYIGLAMMITLVPLSLLYKYPRGYSLPADEANNNATDLTRNFKPIDMLKTYQWYLMYFSFAFTVSVVLIFGAQMKMVAREFHITDDYFGLLLILFPLGNGLSRILAGSISDKLGREKTMVTFYALLGISILGFVWLAHIPPLFVIIVFFAALLGGAPFALYPAIIGDYYGPGYSTANYGITYTAKAVAGLISGWFGGFMAMRLGSYRLLLVLVAIGSLMAAGISLPRFMNPPKKKTASAGA